METTLEADAVIEQMNGYKVAYRIGKDKYGRLRAHWTSAENPVEWSRDPYRDGHGTRAALLRAIADHVVNGGGRLIEATDEVRRAVAEMEAEEKARRRKKAEAEAKLRAECEAHEVEYRVREAAARSARCKREEIELRGQDDYRELVRALTYKGLAIHSDGRPNSYRITHIASGLGVIPSYADMSASLARIVMVYLADHLDWTADAKTVTKGGRDLVRGAYKFFGLNGR